MTAHVRRRALPVLIAFMFIAPCTVRAQCVVPDNGGGTVTLPPAGCAYLSPADVHRIIDGLPPGTTIELGVQHDRFICPPASPVCSFPPPAPGDCVQVGGGLGGDQECANSQLLLTMKGTGALAGWMRTIPLAVSFETHTGPRVPGNPVQSFDTDMFRLQGQRVNPGAGDPDFDLLRITAGSDFSLPSPGHTTLVRQGPPGSPFAVDSFFDITYRIDYVGRPGGALGGMSGSTTGTIRMATGSGAGCLHGQADCDDANPCTTDSCQIDTCIALDNGGGTVDLPPAGCGYVSPQDVHAIIDGLPPGAELRLGVQHAGFLVNFSGPGGSLGGEVEQFDSMLNLSITGTGPMGGYSRLVTVPAAAETHIGPRTPGTSPQSFPTDMFQMLGQIIGDPDFDLLRITAGTAFGMPSPGHTTLTQQPDGTWAVDSFFDVFYRIDFVGAPGGPLGGMSGSTTGTIRMGASGGGTCVSAPVVCDDGNPCTADSCNPATGRCEFDPVNCDDGNPCTTDSCAPSGGPACDVPDNGTGTATLPPAGCGYVSPADVHEIIDGLPAGTTIQVSATHKDFFCPAASGICSFLPPVPGSDCDQAGGGLGGEQECSASTLALDLTGTGMLAGFHRTIDLGIDFETHTAPRTPGMPVQSFDTDMFRLFGQIAGGGDPDFDLLRIVGGTDFGLPSPGHTTLRQNGPGWAVDSFFDIAYRIDFVGDPGGALAGMSGSTTGTIRMLTGDGGCVHSPVTCDDGDPCTADSCNPATGQCDHAPGPCDDGNLCTADSCVSLGAPDCTVVDNGGGTATLPPAGCGYVSPADVHEIIDGLPAGTTIELAAEHRSFFCGVQNQVCSFPLLPGDCDQAGGVLGGEKECAKSELAMNLTGTGMLAGFNRQVMLPIDFETHTAPRAPGTSPQSFDAQMFRLFGQITNPGSGDPDFDLLRIVAGNDFALPSPGHTTLTQLPGGSWAVDSFFDITYRIDFVGKPGGALSGMSGSTTGTIRMAVGDGGCINNPVVCDDGDPCTADRCNPLTGQCDVTPVVCDDGDLCTADSCNPLAGGCVYTPVACDDGDLCTIDRCVSSGGTACEVPDNGSGTATLPPAGCGYVSPADVHEIIAGLPAGTTIQVAAEHKGFFCGGGVNPVCSFQTMLGNCDEPGGSLGGEKECAQSVLSLDLTGTGMLAGFMRTIDLDIGFETHTAPRMPGMSPQAFDTDMFRLFGQIAGGGDPDFDLLRITAGTDFALPSPGHTTLTQLPGGSWSVDSFFDINYRIDFVGAPGGGLAGMSGSTTGTIRMVTGGGGCVHEPVTCDDGDPCTADSCNPNTGQCEHTPVPCDDGNLCTADSCVSLGAPDCTVADNGGGTATLPPAGCGYVSPADVHEIIDGLPPGTTIELAVEHRSFFCGGVNPICSFQTLPGDCDRPGGVLGGEQECSESTLAMNLTGTGMLAGFHRTVMVPSSFETHTAPRMPGEPVQAFDTQMFRLFGQITNPGSGDPDFDLLRIVAGNDFGLPSPGHTTLIEVPGGNWDVDSFFDITYRIDFVGRPGGALSGMSGSTTGTIRMAAGDGGCINNPIVCDDGNPCTADRCNPLTGQCEFTPVVCDDGIACTMDSCNPASGLCEFAPGPPAPPIGFTMRFPNPIQLDWTAVPGATHWNVYRGQRNVVGPPFYNHECYVSGAMAPSIPEPMNPPLHEVFYYLVSQENQCGESGLGTSSLPAPRPNPLTCPTPP